MEVLIAYAWVILTLVAVFIISVFNGQLLVAGAAAFIIAVSAEMLRRELDRGKKKP